VAVGVDVAVGIDVAVGAGVAVDVGEVTMRSGCGGRRKKTITTPRMITLITVIRI